MSALDDQIARLYVDERLTMAKIAQRVYLSESGVRNALIRKDVRRRRRGGVWHFLAQDEVQRTIDLYLTGGPGGFGMSIGEVGLEVGRHATTVAERLSQAGCPTRTHAEWAAIIRSRRALADDLGV